MDYSKIIRVEPGKRSGKPCIRGLRITVSDVLDYSASGMTHEQILRDFPYLTEEDIQACLAFAADRDAEQASSLVKLLFDENLSPGLVSGLADLFPHSAHVNECGLGGVSDTAIWAFTAKEGFTIVSKDWDFHDQAVLRTGQPKVIWLRMGNCN